MIAGSGTGASVLAKMCEVYGENRTQRLGLGVDVERKVFYWWKDKQGGKVGQGMNDDRVRVLFVGSYWQFVNRAMGRLGRVLSEDIENGL
jgi:hypothetical protein